MMNEKQRRLIIYRVGWEEGGKKREWDKEEGTLLSMPFCILYCFVSFKTMLMFLIFKK